MNMTNKLISLELQGYKTFASKTDFNFPGQITAIVGPNGSGKSNISDAIRWVLGEQAYSLLRGKKTIDMIFSGSEQKARASMASVTITFDNQNGWLPVEFSEVSITRRAYRSGENEYLLNKQKVRLKEINELLANSGLGERTYTIIGQGLVDTALSLKPEERRRFFEEASGIGLYRSRREEAIQKLDKTLRNMERVQDILRELHPRLSYLEKSKEKAKQFLQVQDDLHILLKDWYGFHWHSVQKELKYAHDFNNQQNEILNNKREDKQKLESQLNKIQIDLNQKRGQLADWHLELARLHTTKEDATREIAVLAERERYLQERKQEIESALLMLQEENTQHETDLKVFVQNHQKAIEELAQADSDLNEANAKLEQRRLQRDKIEKQIDVTRKQIITDEAEILKIESRLEQLDRQAINDEGEVLNLRKNQSEMQTAITESEKSKQVKLQEIDRLREEMQSIQTQLDDRRKMHEQQRQKVNEIQQKIQKTEMAALKCAAELKILQEAEESLAGFTSGSKEFIQAARNKKISAKYALLLDYLKIPQKYETAIGAALGEMLEGIILEEGSSTDEILEYLAENKINRTLFLPNWWKVTIPQTDIDSGRAIKASALLENLNDHADFLQRLLATTLIVDDAQEAQRIVQQLAPGMKVVTLRGEVFDTRGTISAGREAHSKNLSRKREKEDLQNEVRSLNEATATLKNDQDQMYKQIQQSEQEIDGLTNRNQALQKKQQAQEIEQHKLVLEARQKEEQLSGLSRRLEQINSAIKKYTDEKKHLQEDLSDLQKKVQANKDHLEKHYKRITDLPMEDLRTQVMGLTAEKAVSEQIAAQHQNRLEERQRSFEETKAKLKTEQERLAEIRQSTESLQAEYQRLRDEDARVSTEIDGLSVKIKLLEEDVEASIQQQGNLLEEVDGSRNQYAIAERHTLQSQMKVDKLRDRLDDLRKRIQEDFGLLPYESEAGLVSAKPLPLEGMIASLSEIEFLPQNLEEQIKQQKSYLRRLGPINPEAQREFDEVNDRMSFLSEQLQDLEKAEKDLRQVVNELDELMKKEFIKTFRKVEEEFKNIFAQLFTGGSARLFIEDENNIMESGIEIEATLPGKRRQELALLSGGERSLTAVALIFALLKISPTPFCVLDEVDAMLDESNVMRFGELLRELSESTQFIVITHNRNTVQLADVLYGVTMGKDSVSQVISLRMDELTDEMVQ